MINTNAAIHLTNILMKEKLGGRSVGAKYRHLQRCEIIERGDTEAAKVLDFVLGYTPVAEIKNKRITMLLLRKR